MLLDLRCKAALGPNKVEAGKKKEEEENLKEEEKKRGGGGDGPRDKQR